MKKILLLAFLFMFLSPICKAQSPPSYGMRKTGYDSLEQTVVVTVGFDAGYMMIYNSGSGAAYFKRFLNGTTIDSSYLRIPANSAYTSYIRCDVVWVRKSSAADYLSYEFAK